MGRNFRTVHGGKRLSKLQKRTTRGKTTKYREEFGQLLIFNVNTIKSKQIILLNSVVATSFNESKLLLPRTSDDFFFRAIFLRGHRNPALCQRRQDYDLQIDLM